MQTREVTRKQEIFVSALVKGKSQREAYIEAYPNSKYWKDNAIDSTACKLLKTPKVLQRYEELKEIATNSAIMSATERKMWLTHMIQNLEVRDENKLKALDILNKMSGEYIEKHEVKAQMTIEDFLKSNEPTL